MLGSQKTVFLLGLIIHSLSKSRSYRIFFLISVHEKVIQVQQHADIGLLQCNFGVANSSANGSAITKDRFSNGLQQRIVTKAEVATVIAARY